MGDGNEKTFRVGEDYIPPMGDRPARRREAARRKLLGIISRSKLEDLSEMDRPWHASKAELITACIARWNHDEVQTIVLSILEEARLVVAHPQSEGRDR